MKKFRTKSAVAVVLAITLLMSLFSTTVLAADPLVDPSRDVTLTVHKYGVTEDGTGLFPLQGNSDVVSSAEFPEGSIPAEYEELEGVTFAAYEITEENKDALEDFDGKTTIPDEEMYTPAETVTTDANGEATFNNLNQARYLVVETDAPAKVTQKSVNFLVDLPYTNDDLTTWNYDVHVYPKNYTVLGAVELTKTIEDDTMPAGISAQFKLQYEDADGNWQDMTDAEGNTKIYTTDDEGKIYVGDLVVGNYQFIETKAPEGYGINTTPIPFIIDKDASVKVEKVEMDNSSLPTIDKKVSEDGTVFGTVANVFADTPATWKVSPVVPNDVATYSKYIVNDQVDPRLVIDSESVVVTANAGTPDEKTLVESQDYNLVINNNLLTVTFIEGTFVAGQAALDSVSSLEITYQTTIDTTQPDAIGEDIPNMATLTYNNSYQEEDTTVETDDVVVHTGGKKFVKVDSADETKTLAGAEFMIYATEEDAKSGTNALMNNETMEEIVLTSDADGAFEVVGLAYDEYWLVETKAPDGYHLNKEPIKFEISATSYETGTPAMMIKNVEKPDLPLTGGQGAMMFTLIGLALVGLASVLFVRYRKSKSNA